MATKAVQVQSQPVSKVEDTLALGKVFADSGYFQDSRSAAQAVVKILVGQELGFSPMASMMGVHVIEGKPSLSAHLMASAIKRSGRYDYEIKEHDKKTCTIDYIAVSGSERKKLGTITATLQEFIDNGTAVGKDSKLKTNWAKFPDDMLFARNIGKGYRRYCPDLAGGLVCYTEGEIEVEAPHSNGGPSVVAVNNPPAPLVIENKTVEVAVAIVQETKPEEQQSASTPPQEDFYLNAEQKKWVGEKLKGKADFAKGILRIIGLERFGIVPQVYFPVVEKIVEKGHAPSWVESDIFQGRKLAVIPGDELPKILSDLDAKTAF
jgi:hypothetical protein